MGSEMVQEILILLAILVATLFLLFVKKRVNPAKECWLIVGLPQSGKTHLFFKASIFLMSAYNRRKTSLDNAFSGFE